MLISFGLGVLGGLGWWWWLVGCGGGVSCVGLVDSCGLVGI